jgi:hypothetical protein
MVHHLFLFGGSSASSNMLSSQTSEGILVTTQFSKGANHGQ